MPAIVGWEKQIGRRVKLRDLFVFLTIVECGSMTKAAKKLGVSTPSISEAISALELIVGAPLLDRTPRGVAPTTYGEILLARGNSAIDELRQGIREIEFRSGEGSGEVTIGCPESLAHFLVQVIERVSERYPRIRFNVQQVSWPTIDFKELHDRRVDLVMARTGVHKDSRLAADVAVEVLFEDPFSVVVGRNSPWARRRSIDLAELTEAKWIMTPLDVLAGLLVRRSFEIRGLPVPTPHVATSSIHLRSQLASRGDYLSVLPRSVLDLTAEIYGLKRLPIELNNFSSRVAVVTLKGRTLTPAAGAVVECAREIALAYRS